VTLAVNFLHAEEAAGGPLQLHKSPASLNRIVERAIEDERARARLKRITLQADLDSALPSVDLDAPMISRAVTNLLSIALHHSAEGSVVLVETRRVETDVVLRVRDGGPAGEGRAVDGASRDPRLGIVRTIVEAHGGSVSVTTPPGAGSTFVIVFHAVRQ